MPLKIIFMGTPEFAVPILKAVHNSKHDVLSVYTQPPKKQSRGQNITSSPIQKCAIDLQISYRCPENLNNEEEYSFIKKIKPDVVIVVAYGQIIPKKILDLNEINFINIHASLLPKWRGAAPIQRAIMNMDKETGISIMKIENELDAGPVMKFKKIQITSECNFESLSKKMSHMAASTIIECLEILEKNEQKFTPQEKTKATYAKKISKMESKISWQNSAESIVAKINALHPNPGSWLKLNGSRIKIIKAKISNKIGKPGEIIDKNFNIGCLENSVQILELKKEGKRSMHAKEFLKGNELKVGSFLDDV